MEYDEFLNLIKDRLESNFSVMNGGEFENVKAEISSVEKLGDSYRGISFGREGENIRANMDLRKPYEDYLNGVPMDRIYDSIENSVISALQNSKEIDISLLEDYEAVKPKLVLQVVGKEGNEELLSQIPHEDMGDLAAVCRIELENTPDGIASVTIRNPLLERFGVSKEQLFKDALEVSERTHPPVLQSLADTLKGFGMPGMPEMEIPPVFVATNPQKFMGASVMKYSGFMQETAEKLEGNFFIIPSSVHELLFLPEKSAPGLEEMKHMVRDVNETQVEPKDRLSNQVYFYDKDQKTIELADRAVEKQKSREAKAPEKKESVLNKLESKKVEAAKTPIVPGRGKAETVIA